MDLAAYKSFIFGIDHFNSQNAIQCAHQLQPGSSITLMRTEFPETTSIFKTSLKFYQIFKFLNARPCDHSILSMPPTSSCCAALLHCQHLNPVLPICCQDYFGHLNGYFEALKVVGFVQVFLLLPRRCSKKKKNATRQYVSNETFRQKK
ncbi:hypothetical protein HUJ05_007466 [Dendroctonus ponderosae]|nr:hypothetical protein HUJ05_007466 [Dendroctonus ponderosae]